MVGRVFMGRYETFKLLGEGGMGRVYLAKQIDLGRLVVVKVMHDHVASDPKFRERFQRETLLMARFQHPYVVTLYDASLGDSHGPCIVMEYVRGISLDTLLHRNGRLTAARAGRLLGQLCEALYAAHHQEGLIHRDLKPANLMVVDPDTPYEKIKVMDFGLAKLIDTTGGIGTKMQKSDTDINFCVGTPGYISPEQVRGEDTDYRCDIYGVGVMLYEILTGRLPFIREETMDVLFAHATEAPPSFADAGCPDWALPEIEAVVMRCLAKNPHDRPSSARELAELYNKALNQTEDRFAPQPSDLSAPVPTDVEPAAVSMAEEKAAPIPFDANTVVHRLEAWMPDIIATNKLRGFLHDIKGEVIESIPGIIKMRIGGKTYSWLGLARKADIVDLELRLERNDPQQQSRLQITVLMSSPHRKSADPHWRERCNQVFCELRSYLAAAIVAD